MLSRTLSLAVGLMGGLAASQAPEFAQQYRQRLGGAIDELARIVDRFEADARATGVGRSQALERLAGNADDLARRQGASVAATIARRDELVAQQQAMREAGGFGRVALLARRADPEMARAAWRDFEPALPVTTEGAVSAGAGFLAGYGLIGLLALPFGRRRRAAQAA